jgi:hypothetical protein
VGQELEHWLDMWKGMNKANIVFQGMALLLYWLTKFCAPLMKGINSNFQVYLYNNNKKFVHVYVIQKNKLKKSKKKKKGQAHIS